MCAAKGHFLLTWQAVGGGRLQRVTGLMRRLTVEGCLCWTWKCQTRRRGGKNSLDFSKRLTLTPHFWLLWTRATWKFPALVEISTSSTFAHLNLSEEKNSPQTWLCKNIQFFDGMHYFPSCQSTNKWHFFFTTEENTAHKFKEKLPDRCIKPGEGNKNVLLNAHNSSCFYLCSYFPVDDTLHFNTFKGHKL